MIIFRKKWKFSPKKIEAAALNKTNLNEIFSVGKKIHDVIRQCSENCCCSRYLSEFEILQKI